MTISQPVEAKRKRALSARAQATRQRVFDAAEKVFAERGFDGATIREIATEAGEPVGTIHHHGGGKELLFQRTVARRAETLSAKRLEALEQVLSTGAPSLEDVLGAFIRPFFELSAESPRWRDYARLVAYVSVDARWVDVVKECFDAVVELFISAISDLLPGRSRQQIVEGFVYSVSAMLALLTSQERIMSLSVKRQVERTQVDHLIRFCAAGFRVEGSTELLSA